MVVDDAEDIYYAQRMEQQLFTLQGVGGMLKSGIQSGLSHMGGAAKSAASTTYDKSKQMAKDAAVAAYEKSREASQNALLASYAAGKDLVKWGVNKVKKGHNALEGLRRRFVHENRMRRLVGEERARMLHEADEAKMQAMRNELRTAIKVMQTRDTFIEATRQGAGDGAIGAEGSDAARDPEVQSLQMYVRALQEQPDVVSALGVFDAFSLSSDVTRAQLQCASANIDELAERLAAATGIPLEVATNLIAGKASETDVASVASSPHMARHLADLASVVRKQCPLNGGVITTLDRAGGSLPFQRLAGVLMYPTFPTRGIAALHPVGSGKTCFMIAIINSVVAAARVGQHAGFHTIYIVVPNETHIAFWKNDIRCTCGSSYIARHGDFGGAMFIRVPITGDAATRAANPAATLDWITIKFIVITRRLGLPDSFEDSYVLWDEAHTAKAPKNTNAIGMDNAANLYDRLNHTKRVKVALASATLFEKRVADIGVLNVIKPRDPATGAIIDPFPDERTLPGPGSDRRSDTVIPYNGGSSDKEQYRGAVRRCDAEFHSRFFPESKKGELDAEALAACCAGLVSFVSLQSVGVGEVYPQVRVSPQTMRVTTATGSGGSGDAIVMQPEADTPASINLIQQCIQTNYSEGLPRLDVFYIEEPRESGTKGGAKKRSGGSARFNPLPGSLDQLERRVGGARVATLKARTLMHNIKALASAEGLTMADGSTEQGQKQVVFTNSPGMVRVVREMLKTTGVASVAMSASDVQKILRKHKAAFRIKDSDANGDDDNDGAGTKRDERHIDATAQDLISTAQAHRWICVETETDETIGAELRDLKNAVVRAFNTAANVDGSIIEGIVIGKTSREGLSLMDVTHMHLPGGIASVGGGTLDAGDGESKKKIKVVANRGMRTQVCGRISRFRSHCRRGTGTDKQFVRYMMYVQRFPDKRGADDETLDEIVHRASAKETDIERVMAVVRLAAVDADLFGGSSNSDGVFSSSNGMVMPDRNDICFVAANWAADLSLSVQPSAWTGGSDAGLPPMQIYDMAAPVVASTRPAMFHIDGGGTSSQKRPVVWDADVASSSSDSIRPEDVTPEPIIVSAACRAQPGHGYVRMPARWTEGHEKTLVWLWTRMFRAQSDRAIKGEALHPAWSVPMVRAVLEAGGVSHTATPVALKATDRGVIVGNGQLTVVNSAFAKPLAELTVVENGSDVVQMGRDLAAKVSEAAASGVRSHSILPPTVGFGPTYHDDVEVGLRKRAASLRAGQSVLWSLLQRPWGSSRWHKSYDMWAMQGHVPLVDVGLDEEAGDDALEHVLWLLLRMRGVLAASPATPLLFWHALMDQSLRDARAILQELE